jgi:hypothetical protein
MTQIGGRVLKRISVLGATALAVGLTLSAATAQPLPPAHPAPAVVLPPHEIVAIVRSAGLEPLHRPLRQGPGYVLRAVNPVGQEVRVIVDGASGRIVRIIPLPPPRYAVVPPLYAGPPGRIAMVPDGYGPSSRLPGLPPDVGAIPPLGPGVGAFPNAAERPAAGASSRSATPTPPLPRPRPKIATTLPPAAASPPVEAKESKAATTAPPPNAPALAVEQAE